MTIFDEKEGSFLPRQCTNSFLCDCDGKIVWVKVWNSSTPPYSPDLALSDYYLFQNLKKWLSGKRVTQNDEVIYETSAHFEDFNKSYYTEGIETVSYTHLDVYKRQHITQRVSLKST